MFGVARVHSCVCDKFPIYTACKIQFVLFRSQRREWRQQCDADDVQHSASVFALQQSPEAKKKKKKHLEFRKWTCQVELQNSCAARRMNFEDFLYQLSSAYTI